MSSIENYLAQIEDILEDSKNVPFSGKVAVDRDAIYDIIDELRLHFPDEIKEAQKIIENREKYLRDAEKRANIIIDEAHAEAEEIIKDAEGKAVRITSEHEIYKRAVQEGEVLLEEAKQDAKNLRLNAMDYADEVLAKSEQAIKVTLENITGQTQSTQAYFNQMLETLYNNRQELRGIN